MYKCWIKYVWSHCMAYFAFCYRNTERPYISAVKEGNSNILFFRKNTHNFFFLNWKFPSNFTMMLGDMCHIVCCEENISSPCLFSQKSYEFTWK